MYYEKTQNIFFTQLICLTFMMELIIQLISFDVMLLFEKVNLDVTIES